MGGTDDEVAGGEGRKHRDLAFYRCTGPANTPLPEPTRVTGACRAIEKCSRTTKNEAGLDQYQVRNYRAWYARITLAMGAAGHDVVVTVGAGHPEPGVEPGAACRSLSLATCRSRRRSDDELGAYDVYCGRILSNRLSNQRGSIGASGAAPGEHVADNAQLALLCMGDL